MTGNFDVRIMLEVVFGFAEHQEKTAYGLGCKLPLAMNIIKDILKKAAKHVISDTKFVISGNNGNERHYNPSIRYIPYISAISIK